MEINGCPEKVILERIQKLKKGNIVDDCDILGYFKEKGFIYGFSSYYYLESVYVKGWFESWDVFPQGNAPKTTEEADTTEYEYKGNKFSCGGRKFRPTYISGCFKPYLEVVE